MTKIVNSDAGNDYYQINGSAISDSVQPNVKSGAIAGTKTTSIKNGNYEGYEPAQQNIVQIQYTGLQTILGSDQNYSQAAQQENLSDRKMQSLRTRKVGTAIRNNEWVPVSGVFVTEPTVQNDATATSLLSDNAASRNDSDHITFSKGLSNTTKVL